MKTRVTAALVTGSLLLIGGAAMAREVVISKPNTTTTTTTTTVTTTVVTKPAPPVDGAPTVRIALLLDTSNSMDGLIGQAKSQLWAIVNQFTRVKHNGKSPKLLVALYHYGTPTLGKDNGYVKQITPFTTDLDLISEKLYALQTNGGDEYCGWVMRTALDELAWARQPGDYNAIFIAGNEPFSQGPVDYSGVCGVARERGVVVNTIFCGQMSEGIATQWKDGADLGRGSYSSIDQNAVVTVIDCPQDKELSELNRRLNGTYVYYGSEGREGQMRQVTQDVNAAKSSPSSAASRVSSKGGGYYSNGKWDAVDAIKENRVTAEGIDAKTLPPEVAKLSMEERKAYLAKKADERAAIQKRIGEVSREREAYLAAEQKKKGDGAATLDSAMVQSIQKQLLAAGYTVEAK